MKLFEIVGEMIFLANSKNSHAQACGIGDLRSIDRLHAMSVCHDQDWPSLCEIAKSMSKAESRPVMVEISE